MKLCAITAFLWTFASFAQIEVVQFSAEFLKENEVSLKAFRSYETKTLYMSKESAMFKKLDIKYIPTLILFNNGEEIIRVESGISLKLPDNAIQRIEEEIEEIIDNKF
jgi:protein-disulfide isomerase-like protein with CxxC motif